MCFEISGWTKEEQKSAGEDGTGEEQFDLSVHGLIIAVLKRHIPEFPT